MTCLRITRLLLSLLLLGTCAAAHAATDYTDIWYNRVWPGYGFNVVQSNDGVVAADGKVHPFIFVTFFVFGPDNAPTWYTAQLAWNGTDAFMGPVYSSRGTFFAKPWNPAERSGVPAGTATFKPSGDNDYEATLLYVIDGVGSTTTPLERQTLTRTYIGGSYVGYELGQYVGAGCNSASDPYLYSDPYTLTVIDNIAAPIRSVSLQFDYVYSEGLTCVISGDYEQHGLTAVIRNAVYTCNDGSNATAQVAGIRRTPLGLEGSFSAQLGAGCTVNANFSGPLNQ